MELYDLKLKSCNCFSRGLPIAETSSISQEISKYLGNQKRKNLAVLSSFNFDFFANAIEVAAFSENMLIKAHTFGYNQIDQQVLDPGSQLYSIRPDFVLIYLRIEDLFSELNFPLNNASKSRLSGFVDVLTLKLNHWFQNLTDAGIQVMIFSFSRPPYSNLGINDFRHPSGTFRIWESFNEVLYEKSQDFKGVFVIDIELLIRRIGFNNWFEPKYWYMAKMAGGTKYTRELYQEIAPIFRESYGFRKKCLVLDLDNTLWGGIIGEDGLTGIKLGGDYPGNVFNEFQRTIYSLWSKGVLLAINSKNNFSDAEEVFNNHPDMFLQLKHFAAVRINWHDKVENLKSIASELNIGIDSILFIDDSDYEIERVKLGLPEVSVFQVPKDIVLLNSKFREQLKYFDGVVESSEDQSRNRLYTENKQREVHLKASASIEDFLLSLRMVVTLDSLNDFNFSRVLQLFQKTNQFNTTTRRHDEIFLNRVRKDKNWLTYVARLEDNFGDNGIVMVALIEMHGQSARVDSFLMSCRVLGRKLEHITMRLMMEELVNCGIEVLYGEYIASPKNNSVSSLYLDLGFELHDQDSNVITYKKNLKEGLSFDDKYFTVINNKKNHLL